MDETIKRKAYMEGLRLKNTGLDEEVIYARLEKSGIPVELAKEVAKDVMIERSKVDKDAKTIALAMIIIGIVVAIFSAIVVPGIIIIPIGLILGGIYYAIISNRKTNNGIGN